MTEGFPWDELRKILYGGHPTAKVQNGIQTLQKNSHFNKILTARKLQTDRHQTTDGIAITNTRT